MKYGPRKSAQIAVKAIKLREEKLKWREIAKKLQVNQSWLRNWVEKAGYEHNNKHVLKSSPENLLRARQMRSDGICWKLIEREIGVAWRTLQRAICVENSKARNNDL